MLQAQFKNGLPLKKFMYVDCIQDFENNEDMPTNFSNGVKVFVLRKEDVEKTSQNFKTFYVMDNMLWFDYEDQYLICQDLKEETVKYLKEGHKKVMIGIFDSKTSKVNIDIEFSFK